jgi:putative addiction module component (TIGR02574 family)
MPGERKARMTIDEIEAAALELPGDEIDELMDRLAVHRGMDPEIEQSWMEEVDRRLAEVDAGTVELIPIEETLAKMRALLK